MNDYQIGRDVSALEDQVSQLETQVEKLAKLLGYVPDYSTDPYTWKTDAKPKK